MDIDDVIFPSSILLSNKSKLILKLNENKNNKLQLNKTEKFKRSQALGLLLTNNNINKKIKK